MIIKAPMVVIVLLLAGCGQTPMQSAEQHASHATCELGYSVTILAIDKWQTRFTGGYALKKAIPKAEAFLRSNSAAPTEPCYSPAQRARISKGMAMIRCDIRVAPQGRFCPRPAGV